MKIRPKGGEGGDISSKSPRLVDNETYGKLRAAGVENPDRRAFLSDSARLLGAAFVAGPILKSLVNYVNYVRPTHERRVYIPNLELPFPVELPHPEWPIHTQQWVNLLGGRVRREQLVRVLDPDGVWRGRVFFEGFHPQDGVILHPDRDVHVGPDGRVLIDPGDIFAFERGPILADEVVLTGDLPASVMFRRGGLTPDANRFPPHYHLYAGFRRGVRLNHVEQVDICPIPDGSVCPVGELGMITNAHVEAWYKALFEARDSIAFRNGFDDNGFRRLGIYWESEGRVRKVGTGMLRFLFERYERETGHRFPVEIIPVGAFLSPGQVAEEVGGVPAAWILNPDTWDWHFEAWAPRPDVMFDPDSGYVNPSTGLLITWNDGEEAVWQVHGESPNMSDRLVAPYNMSLWALVLTEGDSLSFTGHDGAVVDKDTAQRLSGRSVEGIHQGVLGHGRWDFCKDPSTLALSLRNRSWLNARGNRDPHVVPYFWTGREWGPPHGVFVPRVEN